MLPSLMRYVPRGAPFAERGGRLRGVIDLVSGRYPAFLFGLGVGHLLPVFHFHETTPEHLESRCRYLAENGYRTVSADDMAAFVQNGRSLAPKSVLLAFDDALASLWLIAAPILKRYGFSAVTYAIPGRVAEAADVRPTIDDVAVDAVAADAAPNPFATWPELQALSQSGIIDVQSHTWSHSMIFCSDRASSAVTPANRSDSVFVHPRMNDADPPVFLGSDRLGWPLFDRRSRMSDARRFYPDERACAAVASFVAARGGPAFFTSPTWADELQPHLAAIGGRWESDAERTRAIEHELTAARETLESRLKKPVRHICLPWGVTSALTQSTLARLGFVTAFANRLPGQYAVKAGDDPLYLKRLPNRHIFALPGRGRRPFLTFA